MTEPIEPDETGRIEVDTTAPEPEPDDDELDPRARAAIRKVNNEAHNLRTRLREVEEARESDLARIAAYEKAEVERAAATVLVDPEDIWRHIDAATQETFNDEFGSIVGDRVKEAAQAIVAQRPHLARPQRPPTDQPIEGVARRCRPEPKKTEVDLVVGAARTVDSPQVHGPGARRRPPFALVGDGSLICCIRLPTKGFHYGSLYRWRRPDSDAESGETLVVRPVIDQAVSAKFRPSCRSAPRSADPVVLTDPQASFRG